VPPSLPTFVVFRCPGTEKEPDHPCTPEAVAAIAHALHEPRQPMVVGQDGTTKADEAITGADRAPQPPPNSVRLQPIIEQLGSEPLRVQVKCRKCATVSILRRVDLEHPSVDDADPDLGTVFLTLPSPGDDALIEFAAGVSGKEAVKGSMTNAAFVVGNVGLAATLVTALGLSKSEEIGKQLTASNVSGTALILAIVLGAGAIATALAAMRPRVRMVRMGNLEEVRSALNSEVSERSFLSLLSIILLGLAMVSIAVGFAWVERDAVQKNKKPKTPTGSLKVTIDEVTPAVGVETSWTKAGSGTKLLVTAAGPAVSRAEIDTDDGAAELKSSIRMTRPASGDAKLVVSSVLTKNGTPVTGASKKACYSVSSAGPIVSVDC
jgi:hypothetical protein